MTTQRESKVKAVSKGIAKIASTYAAKTIGVKAILIAALVLLLLLLPIIIVFVFAFFVVLTSSSAGSEEQDFSAYGYEAWAGEISGVPYADLINKAANKHGVDPALIAAIIEQESRFNPKAKSSVGARGLMQLMPLVCRGANLDPDGDCYDPEKNIMAGTAEIARYLKQYNGNLEVALAAYNAGPVAVNKYGGVPPYSETLDYVNRRCKEKGVKKCGVPPLYEKYKKLRTWSQDEPLIVKSTVSKKGFLWPVPGYSRISSPYGMRWHKIRKMHTMHHGIDIPAPIGTNVIAVQDGVVASIEYNNLYVGNVIVINHGSVTSRYVHLHKIKVSPGQRVKAGQVIALSGNTGKWTTGPHLHFEIKAKGVLVNPLSYVKQPKK